MSDEQFKEIRQIIQSAYDLRATTDEAKGIGLLNKAQEKIIENIQPLVDTLSKQQCSTLVGNLYRERNSNFKPSDSAALAIALRDNKYDVPDYLKQFIPIDGGATNDNKRTLSLKSGNK